jgi:HEPN domain-containing protein
MSQSKNQYQAERWLLTAEEDLGVAELLFQAGKYAPACFYCQQSGEKALKALWYLVDAEPWGHSIQRLIVDFPNRAKVVGLETWIEQAALLDKFYIPTRYPNGLPDLTPGQVYRQADAKRGIEAARLLLAGCKNWLEQHLSGDYDTHSQAG